MGNELLTATCKQQAPQLMIQICWEACAAAFVARQALHYNLLLGRQQAARSLDKGLRGMYGTDDIDPVRIRYVFS